MCEREFSVSVTIFRHANSSRRARMRQTHTEHAQRSHRVQKRRHRFISSIYPGVSQCTELYILGVVGVILVPLPSSRFTTFTLFNPTQFYTAVYCGCSPSLRNSSSTLRNEQLHHVFPSDPLRSLPGHKHAFARRGHLTSILSASNLRQHEFEYVKLEPD